MGGDEGVAPEVITNQAGGGTEEVKSKFKIKIMIRIEVEAGHGA